MINKIWFGKRIAAFRRKAGLSQAELAEKLGVTSQAVSKWECGNAIPDIELLLDLSHLYRVSINELLEPNNLVGQLTGFPANPSEIAYFVPEHEEHSAAWADAMVRGEWIKRNWAEAQAGNSYRAEVGRQIAACDGIILEIGTGPGGGFMPYILQANPDAQIIISDLSPTVVQEWKRFLDGTRNFPNLYYSALDFCKMPFKDATIDIISDGGGIGNCIGERAAALREAYRVLKPGGKLITSTGFVNRDTLAELPPTVQKVLLEKRPDIFEDLYKDTVLAGFNKIDSVISGGWYTDDDESAIATLARSLGVNLKFTNYVRYCFKN